MTSTRTDHAPLLERVFAIEPKEGSYPIEGIEGEIPSFLRGTYYVNGPGRFTRGDIRYRHWLDGDGLVCSLRFTDQGVRFTGRYVRGAKLAAEEEAGRALFRTFGTAFEGDQLKRGVALESPVNVSVYPFSDRLLAFGEQGLPWELDPHTLETLGEHTFGGRLNAISPLSAHPCIDPWNGEMFNFGISFSLRQPCLHLYRLDGGGELAYRRRVLMSEPRSVHDFGLSENYVIFYLSPYVLDVEALMREGRTIMDALRWEPQRGSQLIILRREDGEQVASLPIGERFCLHQINAFEEGDRLTVDVIELDRPIYDQYQVLPDLFTDAPQGTPQRFVIDTEAWKVVERGEIAYPPAPDFPAIDPRLDQRSYDDLWVLGISATGKPGRKFFDQLAHLRWSEPNAHDLYQAPPRCYLGGEPVFLPDPGEAGAGAVICQSFDAEAQRSSFLLFDARAIANGPIARLPLSSPVPPLFHAAFHPE